MVVIMVILVLMLILFAMVKIIDVIEESRYRELESAVLRKLGFSSWNSVPEIDERVFVNSRHALEKYDELTFFKERKDKLVTAKMVVQNKKKIANKLTAFLTENEYKQHPQYAKISNKIKSLIKNTNGYKIRVNYVSPTGRVNIQKDLTVVESNIIKYEENPTLLMGKTEYNAYLKEKQKEAIEAKQHEYYERVNKIIEYANKNQSSLFIKGSLEKVDDLIAQLFDRTINSIKRIKDIKSEEWRVIGKFIARIECDIRAIVYENEELLKYYNSPEFLKIKKTCATLMNTQREFNEYIKAKVASISQLFGTRVTRNETVVDDEYNYIRLYKKTITPFTAEVSATVFASAENSPLTYVVKKFYPDQSMYPEQIQKLHLLIEEIETLKDAKRIIENYKKEYQQYLGDVPPYIMEIDEAGFYSRLGFANIDESTLTIEYTFSYTSGGGMAKRTFTIPMTEENIVELIKLLEGKLTMSAFTKEQRTLMTNKLRDAIKKRDGFACCNCQNSIFKEPNLLLEIDHIIPVSKGGYTVAENLQTLCWKCNRAKSNKI